MAQDRTELKIALDQMKRLAERGTWRPTPAAPLELRLTTADAPENVSFAAVAALVDYAREKLGVNLDLRGGGFGCFDMGFTAPMEQGVILDETILNDPRFQGLLNDLNAHTALIRTQGTMRTYSAFYETKFALATNRQQQSGSSDEENGVADLFGADLAAKMSYGLAEVLILDLSQGQPKASLLKRVWRRFALGTGEVRKGTGRVIVRQINLIGLQEFKRLMTDFAGKGTILMVHGYANSFDDAIRSCARSVYKTKIDQLELLPILFSWPSRGKTTRYSADTDTAENSEFTLQNLLHLVSESTNGREVDVLAHSHGNKILVRSLCAEKQSTRISSRRLKRLILVEPDVGQNFLQERLGMLAKESERIVIYHSKNDRALWMAGVLFDSIRAGRDGLPTASETRSLTGRLEVIDASLVAKGLSKHAPHIESPEVIGDIYDLLRDMKPADRFNLRMIDSSSGRWQMVPV